MTEYKIVNVPSSAAQTLERYLLELLYVFEHNDFGDLPAFTAGEWSRRNLKGLISDLKWGLKQEHNSLELQAKSADPVQHPWGGAF